MALGLDSVRTRQRSSPRYPGGPGGRFPGGLLFTAPNEWYFHLFPLTAEREEILPLDYVTDRGLELVSETERTGDHAHLGPPLHWAHLLKYELGPGRDWPAVINARTGEAIGEARTRRPVELLAKLGELLDTAEFDAAVAAARSIRTP